MTQFAFDLPAGALLRSDGTTEFRLWAPSSPAAALVIDDRDQAMAAAGNGWFAASASAPAGTEYRFRVMDGLLVPDPASRRQAKDVHGPSVVVDPSAYRWAHPGWRGRPWHEAVVYELHAGACGGFNGIRERLPALKALGVTVIELMPIADFPGRHNWGYDGVLPYAPDAAYGTPEQLKALVDAAHGLGLDVMLDVVYNHFGPDGAYIHAYAKSFFAEDVKTPWGAAIDFRRDEVRDYFVANALYWLMEYRFDGLRFDAVHAISPPEFLDDMARRIRAAVEPGRHVHLVLEHEGNKASQLRATPDAPGYDAQWTDDWHHCLHVLLTGEREGYYEDFQEPARLLARCLAEGFAYQGEVSRHSGKRRGEPSGRLPTTSFVICLQNHDQIGNRAFGERLTALAEPAALRAAMALLLLTPQIPMLFMGEEWGSRRPFLFFTDHNDELAEAVREGRRDEFKHFKAFQDEATRERIPDPNARSTFEASVPDEADPAMHRLVTTLLALRHARVVPGIPGCRSTGASPVGARAVRAGWRLGTGAELHIAINLGDAPVEAGTLAGEVLYVTEGADANDCRAGRLPARSLIATITAPEARSGAV